MSDAPQCKAAVNRAIGWGLRKFSAREGMIRQAQLRQRRVDNAFIDPPEHSEDRGKEYQLPYTQTASLLPMAALDPTAECAALPVAL